MIRGTFDRYKLSPLNETKIASVSWKCVCWCCGSCAVAEQDANELNIQNGSNGRKMYCSKLQFWCLLWKSGWKLVRPMNWSNRLVSLSTYFFFSMPGRGWCRPHWRRTPFWVFSLRDPSPSGELVKGKGLCWSWLGHCGYHSYKCEQVRKKCAKHA